MKTPSLNKDGGDIVVHHGADGSRSPCGVRIPMNGGTFLRKYVTCLRCLKSLEARKP